MASFSSALRLCTARVGSTPRRGFRQLALRMPRPQLRRCTAPSTRCSATSSSSGSVDYARGRRQASSHTHRTALYAGSFDPPHNGHLDVIRRAAALCDRLVVAVAVNKDKKTVFTTEERLRLVDKMIQTHGGVDGSAPSVEVEVRAFSGLVVEHAKLLGVNFLVRGIRGIGDLDSEARLALLNRELTGIDTVFTLADAKYTHLSSSFVREAAHFGRRLPGALPYSIEEDVYGKLDIPPAAIAGSIDSVGNS